MKLLFLMFLLFSKVLLEDGEYEYELPEEYQKYEEAEEACLEASYTKNDCFNVKLKLEGAQCCLLDYTSSDEAFQNCSLILGSLNDIGDMQESKALIKEIAGYQIYSQDLDVRNKQNYTCKDGNLLIEYGYDE